MKNGIADFIFSYSQPIVCAAIHNGHDVRGDVEQNLYISEEDRLREEDPFTEIFTELASNLIIVNTSRFEVDVNRSKAKSLYLKPEDSWGLKVWKDIPDSDLISISHQKYDNFYENVRKHFYMLEKKFGYFFVYDIHSYNHRRGGPNADPDDPQLNPEIIIGTSNMPDKWKPLVNKLQQKLSKGNYMGRNLDVRVNVKYPGGYFPRWIHNNFPNSACCITLEFKKIFMDEWTSVLQRDKLLLLREILFTSFKDINKYLKQKK